MKRLIFPVLVLFLLSSCSPNYVLRAAYEEGKILWGRERIADVASRPSTPPEVKRKLNLVLEVREYGKSIGLDLKDSFTLYYELDRDIFAWVVLGSKPDSFTLATWWFPIVGTVPYKGHFEKTDAENEARSLSERGYETWVRGTEAMSTLGWFNDPIMSTTLRHDPVGIANTVLHESFHSTVWIPNHVDFNESAANFLGCATAVLFFEWKRNKCGDDDTCREDAEKRMRIAAYAYEREMDVSDAVTRLHGRLDELYGSDLPMEEKLSRRTGIFQEETSTLRAKYKELVALQAVNNAELMQLKLYETNLRRFEALFRKLHGDPLRFIDEMRNIKEAVEKDSSTDPFALLEEKVK